jgi:hypothetical protein
MRQLDGQCHCGNIRYRFTWRTDSAALPLRRCGCDFCCDHAAAWTSDNKGALVVAIREDSEVNRYRFGTDSADFLVCRGCGVVPLAISHIDGTDYAVINTNTLNDYATLEFDKSATDFDGETVADRLARRCRNWIADVSFVDDLVKNRSH